MIIIYSSYSSLVNYSQITSQILERNRDEFKQRTYHNISTKCTLNILLHISLKFPRPYLKNDKCLLILYEGAYTM